jgi:GNAT superfamily N-acetyltransferase
VSPIRALEREDLPAVCRLYERVFRSGTADPPPQLLGYFERTFIDCPWADPSIPSLVYEDSDGKIVGFIGSHARRLRIDGRPIRMGCSGPLVAAPEARNRGVGALLLRRYLAGPQDITITDAATDTVRRMEVGLGGQVLVHASIGWTKVFRPGAALASWLSHRHRWPMLARLVGLVAPVLDAAAPMLDSAAPGRLRRRAGLVQAQPDAQAVPLTVDALLEQMGNAARTLRLHPDYDAEYLHWLFSELEAVDFRGVPVRHLVYDRSGRVAGWYVYYLTPGGIAQVLQIAAPTGSADLVLDHLFWHAANGGAAAVQGRIEPALLGPLRSHWCLLSRSQLALVYTEDQILLGLLGSPKSLLTRLEGEWWMGHRLLWRGGGHSMSTSPRQLAGEAWSVVEAACRGHLRRGRRGMV